MKNKDKLMVDYKKLPERILGLFISLFGGFLIVASLPPIGFSDLIAGSVLAMGIIILVIGLSFITSIPIFYSRRFKNEM
jgi:hypothetical protein